jgi:uncharacterized protein YcbX
MSYVPRVSRIHVHPVKALAPVRVREARVTRSGGLELDRRWAFVDREGRFINGKNRADLHTVQAQFDLSRLEVCLDGRTYSLERQPAEISHWMSNCLGEPVELREDRAAGFPDDTASPGPTFVSTGSLAQVGDWFDLPLENVRLRFRVNVEFDGVEPFWEDRLYDRMFHAGEVLIQGINPCQRCVVPSRDPRTGTSIAAFQRRFADLREQNLPAGANRSRFNHYYRLAVNTRIPPPESGKRIREDDDVA